MQRRLLTGLVILAALAALVLGALWQSAVRDDRDLVSIAQAGAIEAHVRFVDFQALGEESDYWGGVAAFHTFRTACTLLMEDTSGTADRVYCDEVYGSLLVTPDRAREHITLLIDALEMLSKDVRDPTGWQRMLLLRDALCHG